MCEGPQLPERLLCRSPAFPFETKLETVLGNLSVLLEGAAGRQLFRLRYFPRPRVFPFEQQGKQRHYRLKPGDDEVEVNVCRGAGRAGGAMPGPAGLSAVCPGSNWGWTPWPAA